MVGVLTAGHQVLCLNQLNNSWTVDINLAPDDVQQVFVPLALEESVLQSVAAVECVSRVQTRAVPREVWGPAEGAGAAGAVPAAWRETRIPMPEHMPALPHLEKVWSTILQFYIFK